MLLFLGPVLGHKKSLPKQLGSSLIAYKLVCGTLLILAHICLWTVSSKFLSIDKSICLWTKTSLLAVQ